MLDCMVTCRGADKKPYGNILNDSYITKIVEDSSLLGGVDIKATKSIISESTENSACSPTKLVSKYFGSSIAKDAGANLSKPTLTFGYLQTGNIHCPSVR